MKYENINLSTGLLRLWIAFCCIWTALILYLGYLEIIRISPDVLPWMENSCKEEYSDNISKEFIECVEALSNNAYSKQLRGLIFSLFLGFILIPAVLFLSGFALLKAFKNNLQKKLYVFLTILTKALSRPFNWVVDGFIDKK